VTTGESPLLYVFAVFDSASFAFFVITLVFAAPFELEEKAGLTDSVLES
jgi:hypothetical protein